MAISTYTFRSEHFGFQKFGQDTLPLAASVLAAVKPATKGKTP